MIEKFEEMNINEKLKMGIKDMGFEVGTPIQIEAIPHILDGKDVIGIAQTGTGKTCAFGLPILNNVDRNNKDVQALILSPTRELAVQITEELGSMAKYDEKIKIVSVYGGQPIERQISALKKKPQIIVGTPGRVMDHMRKKTLNINSIKNLILDEADEMLNMGFREDLDYILNKVENDRQTVLFSATMSKEILEITKKYQKKDAINITIKHKQVTAPKIKQYGIKVQENKKVEVLTRIIDANDIKLATIFTNTKRKSAELVETLKLRGYFAEALHGDLRQSERDAVMKKFKTGKINLLVATDVAARGIDVDNIEYVFNYDVPLDEEYYVHRIGRTGRAFKEGIAISFITAKDAYKVKEIEKYAKIKLEDYVIPDLEKVYSKKINKLFEECYNLSVNTSLDNEKKYIDEYLQNVNIPHIDLTASLVRMVLKDTLISNEDLLLKEGRKDTKLREGRVRLFLTVGKKDNMTRNSLRDFLVQNAKIDRSNIHACEVLDKFSFVTVGATEARIIISKLDGIKVGKRKLAIEESNKK